jgi:MFS family permease
MVLLWRSSLWWLLLSIVMTAAAFRNVHHVDPGYNHARKHHHHEEYSLLLVVPRCKSPTMASAYSTGRHVLPLLHAAKAKDSDHDGSKSSSKVTSSTNGWYPQLVVPLWGLYVSNQWTRNSISGLVNFDTSTTTTGGATAYTAMNVDLHFDESQYAILASVAFTSLFAVFSVLAGSIIDVLFCRVLMGVACAFTTPAAYSWINRVVDDGKKSTATSIYGTGVALGSALSSITLILDERLGWRNTLQLIAAVGGSMAAIAAVALPEPSSSPEKGAVASPAADSSSAESKAISVNSGGLATLYAGIQTSLSTERAIWIYMASFFRFSAGLSIGVWSAPFFSIGHGQQCRPSRLVRSVARIH